MNRQEGQPQEENILTKKITRRGFNRGIAHGTAGLVAVLIGGIACGPDGKPLEPQPPTPTPTPEPSLTPEIELQIPIENLPNGLGEIFLGDATPRNLVVRKGGTMTVAGAIRDQNGAENVVCLITDPLRRNSDGTIQTFKGILPASSFTTILSTNGGDYDDQKGIVSLPNGKKGKIQELDSATFESEKAKAGVFFVDRDPLKRDHPLLAYPVIKTPDKSILPDGGTITQLEDGRVIAISPEGIPIARAMLLHNGEWRWTKKEHLVSDFSIRELADAQNLTCIAYCLAQNLGEPEYEEAFLSMFNKLRIGDYMFNKELFSPTVDWRKILDNWDSVKAQFAVGKIPYEAEVFKTFSLRRIEQTLAFAEKYQMPVIGQNLFWWNYNIDAILSDVYSGEEKRRIYEFIVKARVLKYKGRIKEWVGASEVANSEMDWFDPKWKAIYASMGGREIVDAVFRWALEIDPELTMVYTENETTAVNADAYRRITVMSDDLLNYFKLKQTPIHKINEENNFWIYAPPAAGEIKARYQKIKRMGYTIGAPEMTIAVGETFPTWKQRPRTVQSVANKEEAQAKIAVDALEAVLDVGGEFGVFSGTDKDTWYNYGWDPTAQPEILDRNNNAKPTYIAVRGILKNRVGL